MTDSVADIHRTLSLEARAAALREVVLQISRLSEQIDPAANREEALGTLLSCWLELSSWLDCAIEESAHELALLASVRSRSSPA